MTKKSIEDIFKESFENYEPEVKSSVWSNIQTGLKGVGLGALVKLMVNKIGTNTLIAIVTSTVAVVTTVAVVQWNSGSKKAGVIKTAPAKNIAPVNIENPKNEHPIAESTNTVVPEQKMLETKTVIKPDPKEKEKAKSIIANPSSDEPIADIFAVPTSGKAPLLVNFSNAGAGIRNKWNYNDGKKEDKKANTTHVFETAGKFSIILTSTNSRGITKSDTKTVTVRANPLLARKPFEFTPNNDGDKDYFPFNASGKTTKIIDKIFDADGNIMYEFEGEGGKWDGRNKKGEEAKEGKYYFYSSAEDKDGKTYESSGIVFLRR